VDRRPIGLRPGTARAIAVLFAAVAAVCLGLSASPRPASAATTSPAPPPPEPGQGAGRDYCSSYAGSMASMYSFENVFACVGSTKGTTEFDQPGDSYYAWQCVELVARFLWVRNGLTANLATGVRDGADLVSAVHRRYPQVAVGQPAPHSIPVAGDVISLGPGGGADPQDGHTAVVVGADPVGGTITIMSQNVPVNTAGEQILRVDTGGAHNGQVLFNGAWTAASWLVLVGSSPPHPSPATCTRVLPAGSVVGLATTPDGRGYWIASSSGQVAACGDAPALGDGMAGISAIASAPTGTGYWLASGGGAVYSFGTAEYHGGVPPSSPPARPIVALAADPATGGYWLLGGDGGVFSYDAPFYGSTGHLALNAPAVGMEAGRNGSGYRFVAADGGIFAFGAARFYGSMGGSQLRQPVVGITDDPATGGYWIDAADGGIFSFRAPFYGSTGRLDLAEPCVGMAAMPTGSGYRFVAADGGVFDFGSAPFEGSAA
jgi:hypothetical protein